MIWAKDGIWDPDTSSFKERLPKVWERTKSHNIHYVEPKTVIDQLNYLLSEVSQK